MPTTKLTKAAETPLLSDAMETVWHKNVVHIYPIPDSKLEELIAGYNSLYMVFFGICVGAIISLGVTYPQVAMASQKPYYLAALLSSIGLAALFGIAGVAGYVRAAKAKRRLYEECVPIEPPKA